MSSTRSVLDPIALAVIMTAAGLASTSCGEVARTGASPVILIIDSLQASSGADQGTFGAILNSDVETFVSTQVNGQTVRTATIFNDLGRVTLRLTLKNAGSPTGPLGPTTLNEVTISRYRVTYKRADGRNTQGVDVPFGFDGAFTVTVPRDGSVTASFDLVRNQAKLEPPLKNLAGGGSARLVSTIADVTFFGRDLAGNEISVTGSISINFGDFGDPTS